MSNTAHDDKTETLPVEPQVTPDPEEVELQRQLLAHVREFGPRKYQAHYTQAKQLKDSGVDAGVIRKSLIIELRSIPASPEGGVHLISKIHQAKLKAIYHVVRHAVEDAIARRPAQFREEFASAE